jgi:colicin import membrane protein
MENRSLSVVAGLTLLVMAAPIWADEADWDARLKRAASLQADAELRQKSADAAFAAQNQACQQKFLVNACVDKARKANLAETKEVRQMEIEASALEREVKREQIRERDARVAAEAERRKTELPARQELLDAEAAADEARRQQRLKDRADKAEAGAQRKAEQAAAHQRKVAAHEAKIAKRKAREEALATQK